MLNAVEVRLCSFSVECWNSYDVIIITLREKKKKGHNELGCTFEYQNLISYQLIIVVKWRRKRSDEWWNCTQVTHKGNKASVSKVWESDDECENCSCTGGPKNEWLKRRKPICWRRRNKWRKKLLKLDHRHWCERVTRKVKKKCMNAINVWTRVEWVDVYNIFRAEFSVNC